MSTWKVWYQPQTGVAKRYTSGTLTIEPGRAAFDGKQASLTIERARSVGRKMAGMTTWVEVAYDEGGETKHAYFVDRRMLGWSGILGGNEKLARELEGALVQREG